MELFIPEKTTLAIKKENGDIRVNLLFRLILFDLGSLQYSERD